MRTSIRTRILLAMNLLVTTKSGGAGLGLHICRQIVAAHGGRIDYTTSPAGSTFLFELPVE